MEGGTGDAASSGRLHRDGICRIDDYRIDRGAFDLPRPALNFHKYVDVDHDQHDPPTVSERDRRLERLLDGWVEVRASEDLDRGPLEAVASPEVVDGALTARLPLRSLSGGASQIPHHLPARQRSASGPSAYDDRRARSESRRSGSI